MRSAVRCFILVLIFVSVTKAAAEPSRESPHHVIVIEEYQSQRGRQSESRYHEANPSNRESHSFNQKQESITTHDNEQTRSQINDSHRQNSNSKENHSQNGNYKETNLTEENGNNQNNAGSSRNNSTALSSNESISGKEEGPSEASARQEHSEGHRHVNGRGFTDTHGEHRGFDELDFGGLSREEKEEVRDEDIEEITADMYYVLGIKSLREANDAMYQLTGYRKEAEAIQYVMDVTGIKSKDQAYIFLRKVRGSRSCRFVIEFMDTLQGTSNIKVIVDLLRELTNKQDVFKAFKILRVLTGHADFDGIYESLQKLSGEKYIHEVCDFFKHKSNNHVDGVAGVRKEVYDITGGIGPAEFPRIMKVMLPEVDMNGAFNLLILATRTGDLGEAIREFVKIMRTKTIAEAVLLLKTVTKQTQFKYAIEELTQATNRGSIKVIIYSLYKITGKNDMKAVQQVFSDVFESDNIVTVIHKVNKVTKLQEPLYFLMSLLDVTRSDNVTAAGDVIKGLTVKKLSVLDILEQIRIKSGHEDILNFFRKLIVFTGTRSVQQAWEVLKSVTFISDIFLLFDTVSKYTDVDVISFIESILRITNSNNFGVAAAMLCKISNEKHFFEIIRRISEITGIDVVKLFELIITISKRFFFEEVVVVIEEYTDTTNFIDALADLRRATGQQDIISAIEYVKANKPRVERSISSTTSRAEEAAGITAENPTTVKPSSTAAIIPSNENNRRELSPSERSNTKTTEETRTQKPTTIKTNEPTTVADEQIDRSDITSFTENTTDYIENTTGKQITDNSDQNKSLETTNNANENVMTLKQNTDGTFSLIPTEDDSSTSTENATDQISVINSENHQNVTEKNAFESYGQTTAVNTPYSSVQEAREVTYTTESSTDRVRVQSVENEIDEMKSIEKQTETTQMIAEPETEDMTSAIKDTAQYTTESRTDNSDTTEITTKTTNDQLYQVNSNVYDNLSGSYKNEKTETLTDVHTTNQNDNYDFESNKLNFEGNNSGNNTTMVQVTDSTIDSQTKSVQDTSVVLNITEPIREFASENSQEYNEITKPKTQITNSKTNSATEQPVDRSTTTLSPEFVQPNPSYQSRQDSEHPTTELQGTMPQSDGNFTLYQGSTTETKSIEPVTEPSSETKSSDEYDIVDTKEGDTSYNSENSQEHNDITKPKTQITNPKTNRATEQPVDKSTTSLSPELAQPNPSNQPRLNNERPATELQDTMPQSGENFTLNQGSTTETKSIEPVTEPSSETKSSDEYDIVDAIEGDTSYNSENSQEYNEITKPKTQITNSTTNSATEQPVDRSTITLSPEFVQPNPSYQSRQDSEHPTTELQGTMPQSDGNFTLNQGSTTETKSIDPVTEPSSETKSSDEYGNISDDIVDTKEGDTSYNSENSQEYNEITKPKTQITNPKTNRATEQPVDKSTTSLSPELVQPNPSNQPRLNNERPATELQGTMLQSGENFTLSRGSTTETKSIELVTKPSSETKSSDEYDIVDTKEGNTSYNSENSQEHNDITKPKTQIANSKTNSATERPVEKSKITLSPEFVQPNPSSKPRLGGKHPTAELQGSIPQSDGNLALNQRITTETKSLEPVTEPSSETKSSDEYANVSGNIVNSSQEEDTSNGIENSQEYNEAIGPEQPTTDLRNNSSPEQSVHILTTTLLPEFSQPSSPEQPRPDEEQPTREFLRTSSIYVDNLALNQETTTIKSSSVVQYVSEPHTQKESSEDYPYSSDVVDSNEYSQEYYETTEHVPLTTESKTINSIQQTLYVSTTTSSSELSQPNQPPKPSSSDDQSTEIKRTTTKHGGDLSLNHETTSETVTKPSTETRDGYVYVPGVVVDSRQEGDTSNIIDLQKYDEITESQPQRIESETTSTTKQPIQKTSSKSEKNLTFEQETFTELSPIQSVKEPTTETKSSNDYADVSELVNSRQEGNALFSDENSQEYNEINEPEKISTVNESTTTLSPDSITKSQSIQSIRVPSTEAESSADYAYVTDLVDSRQDRNTLYGDENSQEYSKINEPEIISAVDESTTTLSPESITESPSIQSVREPSTEIESSNDGGSNLINIPPEENTLYSVENSQEYNKITEPEIISVVHESTTTLPPQLITESPSIQLVREPATEKESSNDYADVSDLVDSRQERNTLYSDEHSHEYNENNEPETISAVNESTTTLSPQLITESSSIQSVREPSTETESSDDYADVSDLVDSRQEGNTLYSDENSQEYNEIYDPEIISAVNESTTTLSPESITLPYLQSVREPSTETESSDYYADVYDLVDSREEGNILNSDENPQEYNKINEPEIISTVNESTTTLSPESITKSPSLQSIRESSTETESSDDYADVSDLVDSRQEGNTLYSDENPQEYNKINEYEIISEVDESTTTLSPESITESPSIQSVRKPTTGKESSNEYADVSDLVDSRQEGNTLYSDGNSYEYNEINEPKIISAVYESTTTLSPQSITESSSIQSLREPSTETESSDDYADVSDLVDSTQEGNNLYSDENSQEYNEITEPEMIRTVDELTTTLLPELSQPNPSRQLNPTDEFPTELQRIMPKSSENVSLNKGTTTETVTEPSTETESSDDYNNISEIVDSRQEENILYSDENSQEYNKITEPELIRTESAKLSTIQTVDDPTTLSPQSSQPNPSEKLSPSDEHPTELQKNTSKSGSNISLNQEAIAESPSTQSVREQSTEKESSDDYDNVPDLDVNRQEGNKVYSDESSQEYNKINKPEIISTIDESTTTLSPESITESLSIKSVREPSTEIESSDDGGSNLINIPQEGNTLHSDENAQEQNEINKPELFTTVDESTTTLSPELSQPKPTRQLSPSDEHPTDLLRTTAKSEENLAYNQETTTESKSMNSVIEPLTETDSNEDFTVSDGNIDSRQNGDNFNSIDNSQEYDEITEPETQTKKSERIETTEQPLDKSTALPRELSQPSPPGQLRPGSEPTNLLTTTPKSGGKLALNQGRREIIHALEASMNLKILILPNGPAGKNCFCTCEADDAPSLIPTDSLPAELTQA